MFIVFEGLDGSGKSTQAHLLAEWLKKEKGKKVVLTKEPTNNIIGGLIRGQLTGDWQTNMECLQLLYAADRAHHLERKIEPALIKGDIVISDRYYFSSIAYGSLGSKSSWLIDINSQFPVPDHIIYIDLTVKECLNRMRQRQEGDLELFETKKKLTQVKRNYTRILKKFKNVHIINGSLSIKNISAKIKTMLF